MFTVLDYSVVTKKLKEGLHDSQGLPEACEAQSVWDLAPSSKIP